MSDVMLTSLMMSRFGTMPPRNAMLDVSSEIMPRAAERPLGQILSRVPDLRDCKLNFESSRSPVQSPRVRMTPALTYRPLSNTQ